MPKKRICANFAKLATFRLLGIGHSEDEPKQDEGHNLAADVGAWRIRSLRSTSTIWIGTLCWMLVDGSCSFRRGSEGDYLGWLCGIASGSSWDESRWPMTIAV
jgi:hypothetical protein